MRELGKDGILREVRVIEIPPHEVRKLRMTVEAYEDMAKINNQVSISVDIQKRMLWDAMERAGWNRKDNMQIDQVKVMQNIVGHIDQMRRNNA